METPLLVRLRRELYGKKGLVLFNAALIAESGMAYLCNNNVALVYADKHTQESRLASRGLSSEQMYRRLESQFCYAVKKDALERAIEKDNQGRVWTVDNSGGKDEIEGTFEEIISESKLR